MSPAGQAVFIESMGLPNHLMAPNLTVPGSRLSLTFCRSAA